MKQVILKPCPFCGAAGEISTGHTNRTKTGEVFAVGCSSEDCDVDPRTSYREYLEEAISYWNTRRKIKLK